MKATGIYSEEGGGLSMEQKSKDKKSHIREDEEDLKLIRKMKKYADDGYDVELRRAPGGGYKAMKCKKETILVE